MSRARWWLGACLLLGTALAGGGGGTAPSDPEPDDPAPTASQYRAAVTDQSTSDGWYEVYACARLSLGTYTTAHASAVTGSSPYKSSYLAQNVRLYVDGVLVARSPDAVVRVDGASETHYVTSLAPSQVSYGLSCPRALLATYEARGWHKAISIHGHSVSLYSDEVFYG